MFTESYYIYYWKNTCYNDSIVFKRKSSISQIGGQMKEPGDIISFIKTQDYIMIDADLGSGSFGKTVLLKDPYIDELLVAKKYEPELSDLKERFFSSFLQEIKIMFKVNHPNIVRIYNYYIHKSLFTGYILMEYIEGQNIKKYLENYFPLVDDPELDSVFVQLIQGFQYLESSGIAHRDIREGNILITKNGIVKIIDFGLGKMFTSIAKTEDSLVDEINRSGLDTLPNEYFEGEYSAQTDMFYLAELFRRLIRINNLTSSFSYSSILEKMLAPNKSDRYSTFSEIMVLINKKDFSTLEISQSDKEIYQDFSSSLQSIIHVFRSEKEFNSDIAEFQRRLDKLIEKNCFEEYIQNNSDFVKTVLNCSFKYFQTNIPLETISKFLKWFRDLTKSSQQLVLNNIIAKLSTIAEEDPTMDIPF